MAISPTPFVWGPNGQPMTPDQVERLRVVSALAARSGADTSPVGHWTAGLARLVDGWGGYKGNMRADAQEAAGMASADAALQGNPILSSVLGGDQAGMANPSPVVSALAQQGNAASPTQTMPVTSLPGTASAFAGAGGLPSSIVQSESGGNWNALNSEGYGGRGQFGAERLADAARAGVIPAGMTGLEYSRAPEAVQLAVENWHKADILGDLGQYVGVDPDGAGPIPPLTENSLLAVAHLGGKGGARKFVESGGRYNPSDSNGTSLADYAIRHAGVAQAMPASGGAPNNVVAALAQAQGNPWVAKKYGGVIDALMGQQMQRDNATYQAQLSRENASFEQQMRQADPMYQAQLQQAQLQLEQARNPVRQPIEVGGVLLDPVTYQPIFDSRQGANANLPAEVISLQWRAEQAGLTPGTPEYEDFMRNAGRNTSGVPAAFAALDAQAKAAGLVPDTPEYQEFMLGAGAGERARATTVGKAQGEAELGLTGAAQKAQLAITNLQAIRNDPALPSITGMVQGRLPPMSQAGTDLNTRIEQAQGQAFLEAFNSLKGGGAITEVEGTKAEQAMARLNRAQSTPAYQAALDELVGILQSGVKRAYERAGVAMPNGGAASAVSFSPVEAATPPRPAMGGLSIGQVEDGYRYIGGDPADPESWEKN